VGHDEEWASGKQVCRWGVVLLREVVPKPDAKLGFGIAHGFELSEVQWVRPELVCETRFLAWTADAMLRQALYQGLCNTPAREVRRNPTGAASSISPGAL
jgi:ATP-dependent DNA ligase